MLENISNLVLVVCLATSVAGSALVKNKRQFDYPVVHSDPYGHCGKPSVSIPHGGIRLFPTTDFDDIHDNSCNTGDHSIFLGCEPKFYCNEGFELNGDFYLECVENEATGVHEWKGDIPTCVSPQSFSGYYSIYIAFPVVVLVVSIIYIMIRRRIRARSTQRRCVSRTTIVIPPSSTVSTGHSILSGGPPPYERFDDSNIQVPREGTTLSTGTVGTTPNTQAK